MKSHTVSIYREAPEGEIEIHVESDGRSVTGAWLPGTDTTVELTDTERELAAMDATDAAEAEADRDEADRETAYEARRERW